MMQPLRSAVRLLPAEFRPARDSASDVRTLLGMRTWYAVALFALNAIANLLFIAMNLGGVHPAWPLFIGWVAAVAAGAVLLLQPGDPLPAWSTGALVVVGPLAVALTVPFIPTDPLNPNQVWMIGAATAILTYLCIRGRTAWAWLGLVLTFIPILLWSAVTAVGIASGITLTLINIAPLAMATLFAYTIRPAASSIFGLREQEVARAAAAATASATIRERDRQLARLDELARPVLERIAAGEHFTDAERDECRLLEAHLRDTLRAPGLTADPVTTAARNARGRGVEVVLLGDGTFRQSPEPVRTEVLRTLAAELDQATAGCLTARILPPGRDLLATILSSNEHTFRRIEIDHTGEAHASTEAVD